MTTTEIDNWKHMSWCEKGRDIVFQCTCMLEERKLCWLVNAINLLQDDNAELTAALAPLAAIGKSYVMSVVSANLTGGGSLSIPGDWLANCAKAYDVLERIEKRKAESRERIDAGCHE